MPTFKSSSFDLVSLQENTGRPIMYSQTSLVWTVRLSVLYSIVCYPNIFKCPYSVNKNYYTRRDLEYISRCPTFGDFVTILTETSMEDVTVARQKSTRVQPEFLNF
jgi:hypothetical protein